MSSGCGCKEVYRFPHITYLYSCICSFFVAHPYFLFIFKNVFRSCRILHSSTINMGLAQPCPNKQTTKRSGFRSWEQRARCEDLP